jgi:adenylate cyclase
MESMLMDKGVEKKVYPLTKDKKRIPVLTRVGPIKNRNGKIVGAIEVFRDISKEEDLRILEEKFNELVKKYLSSTTYQEVINQTNSDKPVTTQMREMTIMFADVVGFSSFTERYGAQEAAAMLNEFFAICVSEINDHLGDIDKFIGDAVMATFIDANDAVCSAEKILSKLVLANKEREEVGREKIQVHIGINSGTVIQAEIGAIDRKDFTILGDAVNIAARIQEMSEPGTIYISESTYSRLKRSDNFAFFEKLAVKGRKEPISVFRSL